MTGPRCPSCLSRSAWILEKQSATPRLRAINPSAHQPNRPAKPPRYSIQYSRVHTSNQSTTTLKRRSRRVASTARSEA